MGTLGAPPKPEFRVILAAVGRTVSSAGAMSKTKIFLLEDRQLVVIYPNAQNQAARTFHSLESAEFSTSGNAAFYTDTGEKITFFKADCNCGMGVVGYAGITEDGREILTKVRPPEWVVGL